MSKVNIIVLLPPLWLCLLQSFSVSLVFSIFSSLNYLPLCTTFHSLSFFNPYSLHLSLFISPLFSFSIFLSTSCFGCVLRGKIYEIIWSAWTCSLEKGSNRWKRFFGICFIKYQKKRIYSSRFKFKHLRHVFALFCIKVCLQRAYNG